MELGGLASSSRDQQRTFITFYILQSIGISSPFPAFFTKHKQMQNVLH